MCLRSGKRATEVIREVGRITILDSALSLRIGVRLQFHTQLVRTVHNTSLTVGAVRTTSGQNHRNSIGRKDCTRIDVAAVSAHQSIHVPVAVINVGNTVQNIITGRGIVLVRAIPAAFVVITRTGVSIASFMSVVPGTGIGIHCIMADAHAIALTQKRFDCVIGFTRKVRLLIDADTPADRVNSIITLGIHHITVRVLVKSFNLNRKDRNMLVCLLSTCIFQPSVIRNIRMGQKLGIHTPGIRYPRVQEHNGIFVFRTRSTSAIAAIVAKHSRVSRNINCSASQIPVVAVVMRTKIDGLTIPLRVDFKFVTISQGKAHVFTGSTSRKFIIIQHICRKVTRIERPTNLRPVTVSSGFINLTSLEPFGYLVVHVFGDVLVVAIQASNPLVVRGNGNTASSTSRESIRQHSHCCRHTPNSDIAAVFVFRQADAELNCLENNISSLIFFSQFIAQIFESLEVFFAVCFIRYRDAAAIGSEQVIFRYFKSIGRFCCTFDILPIIFQICSAFIGKFPLAVIVEMCGVSALSVRSIDFNGAVFGIGSGDGVAIQNEVRSMPRNLHIAAICANVVQGINNREIHLAALPSEIRCAFKSFCFS